MYTNTIEARVRFLHYFVDDCHTPLPLSRGEKGTVTPGIICFCINQIHSKHNLAFRTPSSYQSGHNEYPKISIPPVIPFSSLSERRRYTP